MVWALAVATLLLSGEYKFDVIAEYDDSLTCEINRAVFIVNYEPFNYDEEVKCYYINE